jgi:hypothetical protein
MTYEHFLKGIAILMGYGLEEKDKWELDLWKRTLENVRICGRNERGVSPDEYLSAIEYMGEREGSFWATLNIPARIISIVETQVDVKKQNAFKDQLLLANNREKDEDEMAKESWGGTEEEAMKNKQKVKEMLRGVFR